MKDIYDEIIKLQAKGECAALATVISTSGSTPRDAGSKMLVRQDGTILGTVGGSLMEGQVQEEAKNVIREGKPKILDFEITGKDKGGMICGGVAKVYIEPIVALSTMYIFGGGHISFSLARIGKMVGFRVVVIDDRAEYANPKRFPEADATIADDYTKAFSQIAINDFSYIVIVTRGHAHDQTVLEWALTTDAYYIGMIGSRKKTKKLFDNLIAQGTSQEALKQVYTPIGLDIKAETPEEIAVSIMAEIIKIRRSGENERKTTCPA